jgi:hypothetical protein
MARLGRPASGAGDQPIAIALDWCHRTADRKRARDEPLQHYVTRTRGSIRSFPLIPQAGSGCSSAGRRSTTSRTSATPRPRNDSVDDSVDVYARASDYIDQVISQIERLQPATRCHQSRSSTRNWSRSFIAWAVRRGTSLPRRCRRQRRIASVRPYGGPRETRVSGARSPARDAGRRTSVTRQVNPQALPSAARRSSQARSHRRHSSADRRQCSW